MTIYSTTTYQACNPEFADISVNQIPCKNTALAHDYDGSKILTNVRSDLLDPSTVLVKIQNNLLMDTYQGIDLEFDYWSERATDFVARLDGDLTLPFQDQDNRVYLITAYRVNEDENAAEIKTIDAEFSPKQIHYTPHLDCAMAIVSILLSNISTTQFLEIERTTVENANYQVTKRLDLHSLRKPENKALRGNAGNYWEVYNLYTEYDREADKNSPYNGLKARKIKRFHYGENLTKVQVQADLEFFKVSQPKVKVLVVHGCVSHNHENQTQLYEQALAEKSRPFDPKNPVSNETNDWIIENYHQSEFIRKSLAKPVSAI